jgi:hypothetical protein
MSADIQNLKQAITDGQLSLAQVLLKTQVVATKLGLHCVRQWVDLELAGFAEEAEPPTYRKVFSQRLEIYNSDRDAWQVAGNLNYALKARQPISDLEALSKQEFIGFPVSKNFSIKNNFGDSFGSDWPQRFVVLGSEYKQVIDAVAQRWIDELETRGITVFNAATFTSFLDAL